MGLLAFFLESAHGNYPRTIRQHLRIKRGPFLVGKPTGDGKKDKEIGQKYAQFGAKRCLKEAMDGGDKTFRQHRFANWRLRYTIQAGEQYAQILAIGVNAQERMLAGIRNKATQASYKAMMERARLDRIFFGIQESTPVSQAPLLRLALSR